MEIDEVKSKNCGCSLTDFTHFLKKIMKLTLAAACRHFRCLLMYNFELSSQKKQNLSERTTLQGYFDIKKTSNMTNF